MLFQKNRMNILILSACGIISGSSLKSVVSKSTLWPFLEIFHGTLCLCPYEAPTQFSFSETIWSGFPALAWIMTDDHAK